jgi:homogentisate 1,2-dioxygenase
MLISISDTYRPPYYHRNAASELMGLIYGDYGGRSDEFKPGSISFECGSTLISSLTTHPSHRKAKS